MPTRIEIDPKRNFGRGEYCFIDERGIKLTKWFAIGRGGYSAMYKHFVKFQDEVIAKINAQKQKELF